MGEKLKLKKLNNSTAVDIKGQGWFRYKGKERHEFWVTCGSCGSKTQYFWSTWPNLEIKFCDECIEWSNDEN
jgi:hypothetical protein